MEITDLMEPSPESISAKIAGPEGPTTKLIITRSSLQESQDVWDCAKEEEEKYQCGIGGESEGGGGAGMEDCVGRSKGA